MGEKGRAVAQTPPPFRQLVPKAKGTLGLDVYQLVGPRALGDSALTAQLIPFAGRVLRHLGDVVHALGDVVHPRPLLGQVLSNAGIRVGGLGDFD